MGATHENLGKYWIFILKSTNFGLHTWFAFYISRVHILLVTNTLTVPHISQADSTVEFAYMIKNEK